MRFIMVSGSMFVVVVVVVGRFICGISRVLRVVLVRRLGFVGVGGRLRLRMVLGVWCSVLV